MRTKCYAVVTNLTTTIHTEKYEAEECIDELEGNVDVTLVEGMFISLDIYNVIAKMCRDLFGELKG